MGVFSSKRLVLLFLSTFLVCSLAPMPSTAQITFERTYGWEHDSYGLCVNQTQDEGYVVTGYGWVVDGYHPYLIKTDSLGDTLWTGIYGEDSDGWCRSVKQTQDGGYVLAGRIYSSSTTYHDAYLVRTDSLGDSLWIRAYGGDFNDCAFCVDQTQDGGYVVVGETHSLGAGSGDVYFIRTDHLGDTIWTRTYGGSSNDCGWSVQETGDRGFIISGCTASYGAGKWDVYLIRADSLGDTLWTRTYGGIDEDMGFGVDETADGGYVVAGVTASDSLHDSHIYIIKTDSVGDSVWSRTYGGSQNTWAWSVQQTEDGGYVIAGNASKFLLMKIDSAGDTVWTRIYGGSDDAFGFCARQTFDGGYIAVGGLGDWTTGPDVYLIKTDENGLTGVEETDTESAMSRRSLRLLQNSPNPFHHSTLISYSLPAIGNVTLSIYDIAGRLVETLVNEIQQPGIHQVRWNRESNPSGVYFYSLRVGEFRETRKMVVLE